MAIPMPTKRAARSAASSRRQGRGRADFPCRHQIADGKRVLANGGRVLNVTAMAPTVEEARNRAYRAVDLIDWPEGFCRRDIAWRAVGPAAVTASARSEARVDPCPIHQTFAAPAGAAALPLWRRAGTRRHQERRARHLLAAHAAALPAQPHQSVAGRGEGRLDHRRYRHQLAGDARTVGEDLRRKLGGKPVNARDRHASSSRPCRAGRLAVRALGRRCG